MTGYKAQVSSVFLFVPEYVGVSKTALVFCVLVLSELAVGGDVTKRQMWGISNRRCFSIRSTNTIKWSSGLLQPRNLAVYVLGVIGSLHRDIWPNLGFPWQYPCQQALHSEVVH